MTGLFLPVIYRTSARGRRCRNLIFFIMEKQINLPRIRTCFSQFSSEERYEAISDEVLTVPDQSMTVQEILTRFASGQVLPIGRKSYYGGDNFDITQNLDFDVIEAFEAEQVLRERLNSAKKAADAEAAAARRSSEADEQKQGGEKGAAEVADNREAAARTE